MIIEHHERLTDEHLLEGVWELLCRYDHAFVPPLSARENTYQQNLSNYDVKSPTPKKYFEELKGQSFLIAVEGGRVVGFMSYRPNYIIEDLNNEETMYVTTIIVEEEQRGKGITTTFYNTLFSRLTKGETVTTRTWSTNDSHIRILFKLGFREIKHIEGSRGEGLDTVYYQKIIEGASN